MNKRQGIMGLLLGSVALIAQATPRAVLSVAGGGVSTRVDGNQNITLIAPFQNNYATHQRKQSGEVGFFVGLEPANPAQFKLQWGVAYYNNAPFHVTGAVTQFLDPAMRNLAYQYTIKSQRVMFEAKLLTTVRGTYHPYLVGSLGEAFNKASGYTEQGFTDDSLSLMPGFGNRTTHALASSIGVGLDKELNASFRLGCMLRMTCLGRASLEPAPWQDSATSLSTNRLMSDEFLIQLSYLG